MAQKVRKKLYIEDDVYQASLKRVRHLYEKFDKVVVSFSGGKDSTAVLNVTLEVARELGKLPLEVVFFDEEAIHPTTIDYVKRVAESDEVDLKWYCLEFKHRNACSNEEPYWYTWEKGKESVWVRELPKEAITTHKHFRKGVTFQEFSPYLYDRSEGNIAMLTGIRTQESLRRYQVIAKKKNDCYINSVSEKNRGQYRCFPIYDWSSEDVWLAVYKFGWDYNTTYDIFNKTKLFNKFLTQRVCPPFGEEPVRGLWLYAECFPEMWHKMLKRVKGVASAWRYGNTQLYSNAKIKPDNLTYKEYLKVIVDSFEGTWKNQVKKQINRYIKNHYKKSRLPIAEVQPDLISGVSYQFLCRVAIRGDFKGRQSNTLTTIGDKERKKKGITLKEAINIQGK